MTIKVEYVRRYHWEKKNFGYNRSYFIAVLIIFRVFCPEKLLHCGRRNVGCSSAESGSSIPNSGTKAAVLPGMNKCNSFPLLSATHSLFSTWTDLKRSETIPGATSWRCGEWIWLTGSSGLHRNSPQGLNISSIRVYDEIRVPEIPITLHSHCCTIGWYIFELSFSPIWMADVSTCVANFYRSVVILVSCTEVERLLNYMFDLFPHITPSCQGLLTSNDANPTNCLAE